MARKGSELLANRKMIRPPARVKTPPPPIMEMVLKQDFITHECKWKAVIVEDGIVLGFDDEIAFIGMSARGARQLASELLQRADELDEAQCDPPAVYPMTEQK